VRDQRERILRALAETMVRKGYVGTAVADVLRTAGVSRETFYQQFSSKEDCFISAYEAAVGILLTGMMQAATAAGDAAGEECGDLRADALARLDRALGAYLDALAAEPAFARLFLVETYAAGPAVLERRAATQQQVVGLVSTLLQADTDDERFVAEAFVAATIAMVTARIAVGDVDALRALRAPLMRLAARLLASA
jgi:AcrR family transcriptional regulator